MILHVCCNLAGSTVFMQLFEALAARAELNPEAVFLDKERVAYLENTIENELSAFEKMSKELPITRRIVITLDEEKTIETDTDLIEIIPIWKWLLMCDRVL